jgi:hypothetical protein
MAALVVSFMKELLALHKSLQALAQEFRVRFLLKDHAKMKRIAASVITRPLNIFSQIQILVP